MLGVFVGDPNVPLVAESFPDWSVDGSGHTTLWVCLRDKPANDGTKYGAAVEWPAWSELRANADTDRPLNASYIERIRHHGIAVRAQSRWLNAVSVEATGQQMRWLQKQPFVARLRPVARMVAPRASTVRLETGGGGKRQNRTQDIDYGDSFQQLSSIGVTVLHGLGYLGAGVRVGVLDSGFNFHKHPAFAELRVIASRDFINGDDIVWDETAQSETGDETTSDQNGHGTRVLSLLAAQAEGIIDRGCP